MYGIGIQRFHREDYVLPIGDLKTIDHIFLTYTKEEILNLLKQNDSVITETNPDMLVIKKYQNEKWKDVDMITDAAILEFSFEQILNSKEEVQILHILYNHFANYFKKTYIRPEFKSVISAMNVGKEAFLERLSLLNYDEEREIRLYFWKSYPLLGIPKFSLERKVEEN